MEVDQIDSEKERERYNCTHLGTVLFFVNKFQDFGAMRQKRALVCKIYFLFSPSSLTSRCKKSPGAAVAAAEDPKPPLLTVETDPIGSGIE